MPTFSFSFFTQLSLTVTPILFSLEPETITQLMCLMCLAQMCNHEWLLNMMIGLLLQLMTTSSHYAYLAITDIPSMCSHLDFAIYNNTIADLSYISDTERTIAEASS